MNLNLLDYPKKYKVGVENDIVISVMGSIELSKDELITFSTDNQNKYEVVRKNWGFYATPSLNGRLKDNNLKTCLVRNQHGKYYIWLLEIGKEKELENYVKKENQEIICWLDDEEVLKTISDQFCKKNDLTFLCGSKNLIKVHTYFKKPEGETFFKNYSNNYYRELYQCDHCSHFISTSPPELEIIYEGEYSSDTYKSNLKKNFERIINLSNDKSDNYFRVNRIKDFIEKQSFYKEIKNDFSVLDVGSGLNIFLYNLKKITDWNCLALDPDPIQVEHAKEVCGTDAICTNFNNDLGKIGEFNLITFNKVLEHVINPKLMLEKSKKLLKKNGLVYIELPDGEAAYRDSTEREEFFIEHFHIFSMRSILELIKISGFEPLYLERIKEPSSKYTILAFLKISEN